MSTDAKPTELKTEEWLYLGADFSLSNKKLYHDYKNEKGERQSYARALTPQSPGAIFIVTFAETGNVFYKGQYAPRFVKMIDDLQERASLEVNHRAALAQARNFKQAKADMSHSALSELLAPLAAEYGRRNPAGRAAFIAAIIEEITRRK